MLHTIMISIHLKYSQKKLNIVVCLFAGPTGTVRRESRCEAENIASAENDRRLTFSGVLK